MKKTTSLFFLAGPSAFMRKAFAKTLLALSFGLLTLSSVFAQFPTEFERVELKTGLKNSVAFKFAPDGRAFIIDRFGELLIYKPDILNTVSAGTLQVFSELEDGLIGIALDPNFSSNNYIYLHYSPLNVSVNRVSRFTMNGDQLLTNSEVIMLEWATQRTSCCHAAGDLDFDSQGNLYIATGDNAQHSDFAALDETNSFNSAEKSSSNTNDLRGKILRITPQPDGSYTIPTGNLFTNPADGKPEIYVMGARNPYRIFVDKENTDWLFWGEVGPDSNSFSSPFGPEGRDEINLTKQAENAGWPYFSAENEPYQNTYASPSFYWDPNAPVNNSVWNTGATNLPPAAPAWLDFFHKCYLAGPRYYYDESSTDLKRLPEVFDGVFFYFDFNTSKIWGVRMDASGNVLFSVQIAPDVFPQSADGFIDMKIGPDGHLYILEYGTGCCDNNSGTGKFVRVDYTGLTTNSSPVVQVSADPSNGALPLTVNFSSSGTFDPDGDPITYEWDFDGDGNTDSTDPNPTHIYTQSGTFSAQLKVTDSEDAVSAATVDVVAGNTAAQFVFNSPPDGGLIDWGDEINMDIDVIDLEDGSISGGGINCLDINVIPSLGHLNHFHDENTLNACPQTLTLEYEGHDIFGEMDIFYVFGVNYTDQGGLQSFDQIQLHPKRKEAEYFDQSNGVSVIPNTDPYEGGSEAIRVNRASHIVLEGRNLQNISSVKYKVASTFTNGRIELRTGSTTGPILAITTVPNTGSVENWQIVETTFTDPGGKNDLYFVFENPAHAADIFDLNYIEFAGAGVSSDATPPEVIASRIVDQTTVEVEFSEKITNTSATNLANISIDQGVSVSGAQLLPDARTISYTVSNLNLGDTYQLNISGMVNEAGLTMSPAVASVTFGQSLLLNAGGPQVVNGGLTFEADQYVTGASLFTSVVPINGTSNDEIYQTENYGNFSYEIPVTNNGDFDIRLHFAELFYDNVGQRIFDVSIEGNVVLDNFDILSQVAKNTALVEEFNDITVNDGFISIQFTGVTGNPKLSALEILPPNTFGATPSIVITSPQNNASVTQPFQVAFTVENWVIETGNTHMHYYVDGVMVGPHYSYNPIAFSSLPEGMHTIRLELFNANHTGSGYFDEVTVNVVDSNNQSNLRINAGGPMYTFSSQTWDADNYFGPGSDTYSNPVAIAGTEDDEVYQTERWQNNGDLVANIPVANGNYDVLLHFAELYYGPVVAGGIGERIFNIDVEGQFQLNNYDITESAGAAATADIVSAAGISVTDGILTITLGAVTDNPKISGIEIFPAGTASLPPLADAGTDITISLPTTTANLVASGSDPDGGTVTYQWAQLNGPNTASLNGDDTANLEASNLILGTYEFEVTVTDDENETTTDQVLVTVQDPNACPSLPFPDQWTTHVIGTELPWRSVYIFPHYDLDGDNLKDIVTGAWWYKNPGTAGGNWVRSTIGSPFNNVVMVYDFDGDGFMDLLGTQGDYESSALVWARNDGAGNFTVYSNLPVGDNTYSEPFLAGLAAGEFQQGGPFQIALNWNGSEQTNDPMQVLTPPVDPINGTWVLEDLSPDSLGEDLKAVDLDDDGDLDLFQSTNWLRNDLSTGGGWTTIPTGISYSTTPDRVQIADFNQDGRMDAAIGQLGLGGGNKYEFAWFEGPANPEGTWTKHVLANDIQGSLSVFVKDIDFDGDDDIVVGEWRGTERLIAFENDLCNSGTWIRHTIDAGGEGFDHHDGAQVVDIDDDGDWDVVSIGWDNITPRVFENLSGPPTDLPPTVSAGVDQNITLPTNFIQLNGSGSDPDGGSITYAWSKESGPAATLNNADQPSLNVSDMLEGTYVFRLTVTDDENDTAFADVTVIVNPDNSNIVVSGVTVTPMTATAYIGGAGVNLSADVQPSNAADTSVSWSSSDEGIATVSPSGVVTAVAVGTATITATTTDGGFTSSSTVTVENAPPSDLPWIETFDELTAGATMDTGLTAWTTTTDQGSLEVANGKLEMRSVEGGSLAFFNSEVLDISTHTDVSISLEVSDLDQNQKENSDYLKAYYILDGGSQVQFGGVINDIDPQTFSVSNLNGSTLQLVVEIKVSWFNEFFTIDNINIDGTSTGPVAVTGVTVTPPSATVTEGGTTNLTANVLPANATDSSVSWSSSDEGIATVSPAGVVTAIAEGTATITATTTDGGFTSSSIITVEAIVPIPVTGVTVTPMTATAYIGGAGVNLSADVQPSNADDTSVSWSSSDEGIATVSPSGVVTAVAVGTATITATTTDGGFTSSSTVTVENAPPSDLPWIETFDELTAGATMDTGLTAWTTTTDQGSLEVANGKLVLNAVQGGTLAFFNSEVLDISNYSTVNIYLELSDSGNNQKENSDYAKVYYIIDGGVPIEFGSVINDITTPVASFGLELPNGVYSTLQIRVEMKVSWDNEDYELDNINITGTPNGPVAVTGVSVNPTSAIMNVGASDLSLTANVLPANATDSSVSWSSSDTGVVTVSPSGVVTAVANGTATVTATTTDGGFTASSTITVQDAPAGDLPWIETFDELTNGDTSDTGETAWTTTADFGTLEVANGQLEMKSVEGGSTAFFNSEVLDISTYSNVSISVDISDLDQNTKEPSDYVKVYYRLNGGGLTQFGSVNDDTELQTFTVGSLNGNSLEVVVEVKVSWFTETYTIDNVSVTGTPNGTQSVTGTLQEFNRQLAVKLYPNPAVNLVDIQIDPRQSIQEVSLFDVAGRRVRMYKNNINFLSSNHVNIDLGGLESGIFTVYIQTIDGEVFRKRMIKK